MTQIHVIKNTQIETGGRCLLAGKVQTLETTSSMEKVGVQKKTISIFCGSF